MKRCNGAQLFLDCTFQVTFVMHRAAVLVAAVIGLAGTAYAQNAQANVFEFPDVLAQGNIIFFRSLLFDGCIPLTAFALLLYAAVKKSVRGTPPPIDLGALLLARVIRHVEQT